MKKCSDDEKQLFIEQMKTLKKQIDSEFKAYNKTLTPDDFLLQKFLFDTHGLVTEDISDIFYFRKKNSNELYTFKFPVKCISNSGCQYMQMFDVPLTLSDNMTKAVFTIKKLIENQNTYNYHLYINCCNFYANKLNTKAESMANLHCLYCDLDGIPDVDFTAMSDNEIKEFLNERYSHAFSVIPFPNYLTVSSKSGIHMYFLLKDYAVQSYYGSNIEMWRTCGNGLQGLFNVPEFDVKVSKDTQRILRLPGSTNIKPEKMFKTRLIHCHDFKHTLDDFYKILNPYVIIKEKIIKPKKNSISKVKKVSKVRSIKKKEKKVQYDASSFKFVEHQLTPRYNDLMCWFMKHRNNINGKRDIFFFILVNTMHYMKKDKKTIRDKVLYLNNLLPEPLSISELEGSILNYNKRYLIGNYKVSKWLEFTQEEIDSFSGKYISNDKEYNRRAKKLNNEQLTIKRKLNRGVHNKKVKALLFVHKNKKMTNAAIAKTLDCSVRTVQRLRNSVSKLFKKQGMTKIADAIKCKCDNVINRNVLGKNMQNELENYHQCNDYKFFDDSGGMLFLSS